ncbi:MAG: hypothetical protein PWQ59_1372 [Thermoanaerobacterium sp.]|nr:hypothetical protein [Thermoanaerobacterium sp.]MDI3529470.1 hypothetical protein [Thermoanaerobacter sp.]
MSSLSLGINVGDVFGYISQVFTSIWPLLAFGLGLLAFPLLIRSIRSVFSRRG